MTVPLLQLEDVHVGVGGRDTDLRTVEGISLNVDRGECLAIIGETRAGKSALAAALAGLPGAVRMKGVAIFEGRPLTERAGEGGVPRPARRIAFLPSELEDALAPGVAIDRQLLRAVQAGRSVTPTDVRRVRAALLCAGIDPSVAALRCVPGALDAAERARFALAVALARTSDLVIGDEPARRLDRAVQRDLVWHAREHCHASGGAMLWFTKDLEGAERLADRVAVMLNGTIVEEGPARAVLQRPAHPYTRSLVDCLPTRFPAGTRLRPPPLPSRVAIRTTACTFRDRCAGAMHACLAAPPLQPIGDLADARAVRCHQPLSTATPLP